MDYAAGWVVRLGDGTPESRARAQAAVDELWRFTGELFECDDVEAALVADGVAADPEELRVVWQRQVDTALDEATLARPGDVVMQRGGRSGRHTEGFSYLLGELQVVARAHPGASW